MGLLLRYRLSVAIVLGALAATGAAFLFARPQYRPPSQGRSIDLSKYEAAAHGWTWAGGTPGFRFGEHEEDWNLSRIRPSELDGARASAAQAGVAPDSLRVLTAIRTSLPDLTVVLAGADASGRTCLGIQLRRPPATFYCPARLGPQAAFVIATVVPAYTWRGKTSYSWFLLGVVRADVTRLTVSTPGFFQTYYKRGWGAWGTFQASLGTQYPPGKAPGRPWRATVTIYGDHGVLARLPLRYARAGEFLLTPAA